MNLPEFIKGYWLQLTDVMKSSQAIVRMALCGYDCEM